jgi:methanogenic corrinoid protein MtbC1
MAKLPEISHETVERFFAALHEGDRDQAVGIALGELDRGVPTELVVLHLLVPSQLEVGRRWQAGGWSVAQEHLATSCSAAVLSVVTTHVQAPRPTHGKIVVACVEEEWHTLPSRLFSELLYLRGWRPSFLGAAIPTESLISFLTNAEPDALALSCSVAMNLTGAESCIDAAHSLGIPVIVGGRGFGDDDRRARALGADGWAQDLDEACNVLSRWAAEKPRLTRPARRATAEHHELLAKHEAIAKQALDRLGLDAAVAPAVSPERLRRLEKDLAMHLRFAAAALATDDPTVYLDFITWDTWLAPGVAPVDGLTSAIVEALRAELPSSLVETTRLFAQAHERSAKSR